MNRKINLFVILILLSLLIDKGYCQSPEQCIQEEITLKRPIKRRRQPRAIQTKKRRKVQPEAVVDDEQPQEDEKTVVAHEAIDTDEEQNQEEAKKEAQNHDEKHLQIQVQQLRPQLATDDPNDKIEVNLANTDILNLLQWIESIFQVSFISGDTIEPKGPGKVTGNLISFKTQVPLTKAEAWDLFLTLLDLVNLSAVPESYQDGYPNFFRIMPSKPDANQAPVPSFVGVDWKTLPDNNTKIRYVYFVANTDINSLFNIVNDLKSKNANLIKIEPLRALIFIDNAANIRSLMRIVQELDSLATPEMMSVLKLRHADADDVKKLFDALIPAEDKGVTARLFGVKKTPTALYFRERPTIITEPRTNALIVLGTKESIEKVEQFVINYVDTELAQPYSPLYVYELQYANAADVATILDQVTKPMGNVASSYGGVRDGDKFFRPVTITAEPSGNRILIKAEKEDYIKLKEVIKILDVKQPQVAIEVLVVNVTAIDSKELGTQLRNKRVNSVSQNVAFQTSGVRNVAINSNVNNPEGIITDCNGGLMGNLVALAQGQQPGTTLISFGSSLVGGVWLLFKALQTHVDTNVISHPFLVTTNKYTAQVSLGETRRVQVGRVIGGGGTTDTLDDTQANLTVSITPQINSSGIIKMQIKIDINTFTDTNNPTSATKNTKTIETTANVANGEILAIGGLLKKQIDDEVSKVPILGSIPVIGWFFKDRAKTKTKDNLLVFISPQIVEPYMKGGMNAYSENKAEYARCTMASMDPIPDRRDPINRWFFKPSGVENERHFEDFVEKKHSASHNDVTQSCYYRNNTSVVDTACSSNGAILETSPYPPTQASPRKNVVETSPYPPEGQAVPRKNVVETSPYPPTQQTVPRKNVVETSPYPPMQQQVVPRNNVLETSPYPPIAPKKILETSPYPPVRNAAATINTVAEKKPTSIAQTAKRKKSLSSFFESDQEAAA